MAIKNSPTIIITGANGFLGSNLVEHFSQKGWEVRALVRNAPRYKSSLNVKYIEFNLEKPINNRDIIFTGADYLVHTAYVKYNRSNPDAFNINLSAANRLLAASNKYGLKNLFISTMSAHSEAESVYGKQKLAIEKLFNKNHDFVLRLGLIVGNGGIVKEMSDFMKTKHIVPLVAGGKQPLQIIAISDLVGVIERTLTNAKPGVYTVATPEVYTYKEFYRDLSRELDIRVLFIPIPFWALMLMLRIVSLADLSVGISEDNALGLKKLKAVNTEPDLKKLGVKLCTLREALQQLSVI